MKIAIVLWDLNIKGGTQRQALELALNLQNIGHQVDVFCYYYDIEKCYQNICNKLNIYYVSKNRPTRDKRIKRIISIFTPSKRVKELQEVIEKRNINYDVINLHDYNVHTLSQIINHKNIIWMMNDIPAQFFINKVKYFKSIFYLINKIALKKITKRIRKIIVLDYRVKGILKHKYSIESEVIRSGIDLNMYSDLIKHISKDFYQKNIKIFCSGIFFPHRRFEDVVEAITMLKKESSNINFTVTINGNNRRDPNYFNFIRNLVTEKHLEGIITIETGISERELKNQYLESHIFIFPNHEQTWGLSVFEASLAKCACIVSKTAGAHEVLTNGQDALFVEPKSPAEIAKKIKKLNENREYMKKIAQNGNNFVLNNISWQKYAANMLEIFKYEN